MRLHRLIALTGSLSRLKAEAAILEGRVWVNGKQVEMLGTLVDPTQDQVVLDGKPLSLSPQRALLAFYKPIRVMTTCADPQGRRTVLDCLPDPWKTLRPVGRLDFLSEGLLLLTNDGDWAYRWTHPKFQVVKVYQLWTARPLSKEARVRLEQFVELSDGPGAFKQIKECYPGLYEVTVTEGRNRFVRRMIEAVGTFVQRLKRIQIGPYHLEELKPGKFRKETFPAPEELKELSKPRLGKSERSQEGANSIQKGFGIVSGSDQG